MSDEEAGEIFDNPRVHTGAGYYRKDDLSYSSSSSSSSESALRSSLSSIEDRCASLIAEHASVSSQLRSILFEEAEVKRKEAERIEEKRRKAELEEKARKDAELRAENERVKAQAVRLMLIEQMKTDEMNSKRGNNFNYFLRFTKCFPPTMDTTKVVALSNGGYIRINDNGLESYHGIHYDASEAVDREKFENCACSYLACGRNGQYYIAKKNGKSTFKIKCQGLREAIDKNSTSVQLLAFGQDDYTYYVKFNDGSSEWNGNISESFSKICKVHPVKDVHLGSNGSYFVRYELHGEEKISCKGLPSEVMSYCNKYKQKPVKQVLVDEDSDTWFVRYSDKR